MGKAVAKCPPYRLIASVADGDEKAIEKMLQFYDAYLSKCCLRPLYDEYGNLYIAVDMELKGRIREAMIKKMRAFEDGLSLRYTVTLLIIIPIIVSTVTHSSTSQKMQMENMVFITTT